MAFYRYKTVKGHRYWQYVESYRDEDGKPQHRVLKHLGPNPPGNDRRLNELEARLVADEAVKRTPTQDELRRLLATLQVETGSWTYERFGVELDVLKKTRHLRLK